MQTLLLYCGKICFLSLLLPLIKSESGGVDLSTPIDINITNINTPKINDLEKNHRDGNNTLNNVMVKRVVGKNLNSTVHSLNESRLPQRNRSPKVVTIVRRINRTEDRLSLHKRGKMLTPNEKFRRNKQIESERSRSIGYNKVYTFEDDSIRFRIDSERQQEIQREVNKALNKRSRLLKDYRRNQPAGSELKDNLQSKSYRQLHKDLRKPLTFNLEKNVNRKPYTRESLVKTIRQLPVDYLFKSNRFNTWGSTDNFQTTKYAKGRKYRNRKPPILILSEVPKRVNRYKHSTDLNHVRTKIYGQPNRYYGNNYKSINQEGFSRPNQSYVSEYKVNDIHPDIKIFSEYLQTENEDHVKTPNHDNYEILNKDKSQHVAIEGRCEFKNCDKPNILDEAGSVPYLDETISEVRDGDPLPYIIETISEDIANQNHKAASNNYIQERHLALTALRQQAVVKAAVANKLRRLAALRAMQELQAEAIAFQQHQDSSHNVSPHFSLSDTAVPYVNSLTDTYYQPGKRILSLTGMNKDEQTIDLRTQQ